MNDLFNVSNLEAPAIQRSSRISAIRLHNKRNYIYFNCEYLKALGINFEFEGEMYFAANFKSDPPMFVFNLSEEVLKKDLYFQAVPTKNGNTVRTGSKQLSTMLRASANIPLKTEKDHTEFMLEFVADHDGMKYFRIVPQ